MALNSLASPIRSVTASVVLGNKCAVTWIPKNSTFKYRLKFKYQTWSYFYPSSSTYITPGNTNTVRQEVTLDCDDDLLDLMPNIDHDIMTVALISYDNNNTKLDVSYATFNFELPATTCAQIGTVTLETSNALEIGGTTYALSGRTRVCLNVASITAARGSTITNYRIEGPGIYYGTVDGADQQIGEFTTDWGTIPYHQSGTLTYQICVADSRRRTSAVMKTLKCYEYSPPSFQTVSASIDNTGKLTCYFTAKFTDIDNVNTLQYTYRYKIRGVDAYNDWATSSQASTSTSYNFSINNLDKAQIYDVELAIYDQCQTTTIKVDGVKYDEFRPFNMTASGRGVAFGKKATVENCLETATGYEIRSGSDVTITKEQESGYYLQDKKSGNVAAIKTVYDNNADKSHLWIGANGAAGSCVSGNVYINSGTGPGLYANKLVNGTRSNYLIHDHDNYGKVLYAGVGTNATITINLGNNTCSEFKYLEIFYRDNNSNGHNSVKFAGADGDSISCRIALSLINDYSAFDNYGNETKHPNRIYIKRSMYNVIGTGSQLTISPRYAYTNYNSTVYIEGTSIYTSTNNANYIYITKVLGYK